MTKTKTPTRAQLLEECQAKGLKATGWKKERMAEELAKLAGEPPPEAGVPDNAEPRAPEAGDDAGQSERETTAAENPDASPRFTGWCSRTPMWSMHHLNCPAAKGRASCACACHAEGWAQPEPPEGARLSKANPQYQEPAL